MDGIVFKGVVKVVESVANEEGLNVVKLANSVGSKVVKVVNNSVDDFMIVVKP